MLQIASVNHSAVTTPIKYDADLKPLVDRLPLISCEICIIVPVRDEAENIEATLLALTNQVDLDGKPLAKNRYEIIVLANNCADNSAQIARNFATNQPDLRLHVVEMTLKSDRAYIGWVRKLLMDEACRRLKSIGRNRGIIASTDGDTRVFPTWIAAILSEINNGIDAVGGRIVTDRRERLALDKSTRLYFLRYVGYEYLVAQLETSIDPDPFECFPRHHQHYGASLAVTAEIYAKVGGLPPLHSSEDVALYDALKRADARFRHSPMVKVTTSARAIGRAKAGLSDRLSQLKMMAWENQPMLVESAQLVAARYSVRRELRYLWQRRQSQQHSILTIVAQKLDIPKDVLEEIILRSPTFGLVVEQIGYDRQDNDKLAHNWQKISIQKAIADLRLMNQTLNNSHSTSEKIALDALEKIEPILLLPQPL
jgi:hypothetical protein